MPVLRATQPESSDFYSVCLDQWAQAGWWWGVSFVVESSFTCMSSDLHQHLEVHVCCVD
ncbi:hypothetical protein MATL_G00136350 [Megalops atlanticus]|uniref:Uncharacterized protein n=1 Tax=Megalops atlanticus TaxID=7932 RepID=A0A9D3TAY1_MEGAT|nr:hypothetical protein MATL_G00136350 [Megalops atlanticus]